MFVARIHNQALGTCFLVDDWNEGVEEIRTIILKEALPFDENDLVRLEENGEYFDDSDPENFLTLTIGTMDNE